MYGCIILTVVLCFLTRSNALCASNSVKAKGVNAAYIQTIVQGHNAIRLIIAQGELEPDQPKASNMLQMSWDDTLAADAQNLTDSCVFTPRQMKDPRWNQIGQNLAKQTSSAYRLTPNWAVVMGTWYAESESYTYGDTTDVTSVSHYLQMVNSNSKKVGCGYTQYYDASSKTYTQLYACNYGAGVNLQSVPYQTGPGCDELC